MVLDIPTSQIRQERDLSQIESLLCKCAAELALLGNADSSCELLSILYREGPPTGNYSRQYSGLAFAWRETSQSPEGFSEKDFEDAFEVTRSNYEAAWMGIEEDKRTYDERGLEACLAALAGEEDQGADATTGVLSLSKGEKLIKALDISLRLHGLPGRTTRTTRSGTHVGKKMKSADGEAAETLTEDDEVVVTLLDDRSADLVNKIVARWNANQQIVYLTQAEHLWPYYIRGILADAIGVSKEDLMEKGKNLVDAFSKRFEKNPESELASKSMKELLQIGEENTLRKSPGKDYFAEAGFEIPNTMFKAPATEEEIVELEKRLEITLPEDYKEFLRITNGFGENQDGLFNGFFPDPELHTINKVEWNDEEYFQLPVELLNLPRSIEDLAEKQKKSSGDGVLEWDTAFPLFDRVLEIGVRDIDNLWLVNPGLVEQCKAVYKEIYDKSDERQRKVLVRAMETFAGSKEEFEKLVWCCVEWSSGGSACMTAYAGFRQYVQHLVEDSGVDMTTKFRG